MPVFIRREIVLAAVMAAAMAGCSTEVPHAAPPVTPVVEAPAAATADPDPNAQLARKLEDELNSLAATSAEGNLKADEYASARRTAISNFEADLSHFQVTPGMMHDNVGYLASMKKDKHLSDAEFEELRLAVVQRYLPASGR